MYVKTSHAVFLNDEVKNMTHENVRFLGLWYKKASNSNKSQAKSLILFMLKNKHEHLEKILSATPIVNALLFFSYIITVNKIFSCF